MRIFTLLRRYFARIGPLLLILSWALLTARQASAEGVYDLDHQIRFNVLDRIEYDPRSGQFALIGHEDRAYRSNRLPYLQYLATFLENPNPAFSLDWTPESYRRADDLFSRFHSQEEWKRVV